MKRYLLSAVSLGFLSFSAFGQSLPALPAVPDLGGIVASQIPRNIVGVPAITGPNLTQLPTGLPGGLTLPELPGLSFPVAPPALPGVPNPLIPALPFEL